MRKVIIITGGIASGKSFILDLLQALNYPIMKSDEVAKDIMAKDWFIDKICNILCKKDFILKDEIELEPNILDIVENIIYPKIEIIREKFIQDTHRHSLIPVIEIPLFFEKNIIGKLEKYNLEVISTVCGKELQISRAKKRNNFFSDRLLSIVISRQITDKERVARSKFIIYTSLNKTVVKKQLIEILKVING